VKDYALGSTARAAGYRLRAFESVGSTNAEALAAAADGDVGGIWFAALQQTSGRGRRGREWVNPVGNMAATLLVVPDADPSLVATLGFVAGVALADALAELLPDGAVQTQAGVPARIALKWPNDVLADGAKLAGILLEAKKRPDGRHAVAVGIGVNVVAAPSGLAYPAKYLNEFSSSLIAQDLFETLSDAWVNAFRLWDDGRGLAEVLAVWRQSAAGIGGPIAVNQNGEILRGVFETIDDGGRLIVRADNDRLIPITAGDVHFGATASARS
jgi:BirA family biotin operon repressor/biotin-[acetyl-CoA-carboxylase] ligase